MTTTFRIENEFPDVPIEVFEKHLNHPELIEMLKAMPAFRSRDLVERKDLPGGETLWRFKVVAGGEIPGPARKVLSEDMLAWYENTRWVPAEHVIHWSIELLAQKLKDSIESKGTWRLEKKGGGTRRVIDGAVTVKMPLVGKIVEQFLVGELKKNYQVEPDIQRRFYRSMMQREGA